MRAISGEVARFVLVGGAASATHLAVGLGLERFAGLRPWAANIVAFLAALGVSYLGNTLFTFKVDARRADAFVRFAVMQATAFAINQVIVMVLTGPARWPYWAALAVVLVVVPPTTFVISKYWALAERTGP